MFHILNYDGAAFINLGVKPLMRCVVYVYDALTMYANKNNIEQAQE